jgi:D-3-phosphoglycerate dehydrogenase / 2-oxoglutarate reductase
MDILLTEELTGASWRRLEAMGKVIRDLDARSDAERLKRGLREARAALVGGNIRISGEMLAAAGRLSVIGRLGEGSDWIDLEAASKRGIVVLASTADGAVSVAELTFGLLLSLARRIALADRFSRQGATEPQVWLGTEVQGKRLALCGFGPVGQAVAVRARAFGMQLSVYDPGREVDPVVFQQTDAVVFGQIEEALAEADFVSAHLPFTSGTRQMFNSGLFAAMKRGVFFINTGPSGLVDEAALMRALSIGHIAGAALDCWPNGPGSSILGGMDQVILTPRLGAMTFEAQERSSELLVCDIERILSGDPAERYLNFARPAERL